MLTAKGSKRDRTNRFKLGMLFDIFDGDKLVGKLSCNMGATQATLTVDDKPYTMAATEAETDEPLAGLLRQHTEGRAKRNTKPFAFKDANGHTLALAQDVKSTFMVAYAGNVYMLRKASFFSPQHNLYRTDSDRPIGSVGQKSLFARALHMDVPPEFDATSQVFLLLLSLQLAAERAASLSTST
jgi:hypothetical protein